MRSVLFAAILLFVACSDSPVQNQNDSSHVDSMIVMQDTTLPKPKSILLDTLPFQATTTTLVHQDSAIIADAMLKNTPDGFSILDTMTGDLNRDKYVDLLIVLNNDADSLATDVSRPLLILIGTADGDLKLTERGDNVVLCKDCGGVYGDPYDGLAIKNGYFSVEHYGGSAWRWTRIITFRYNEKLNTWLLHRDAGESFYVFEPDEEPTMNLWNEPEYGKMKFTDYSSN